MEVPAVLWLDDPLCRRAELAGNKCATLARLRSKGYDVPNGFCVTAATLSVNVEFRQEPVAEASRHLEAPWVARSSATVEDSPSHAFPGLFETVLGLADVPALLDAIDGIFESRDAELVRKYAERVGVDPSSLEMAVLIQSLVPATVAGVAFSRDPVGSDPHVIIEANYGVGETVVDGSVVSDRFVVSAAGDVIDRVLGSKQQKALVLSDGQVSRTDTSESERSRFALDDRRAVEVAVLTLELEGELGHPVDVEWAIAENRIRILQARPIAARPRP